MFWTHTVFPINFKLISNLHHLSYVSVRIVKFLVNYQHLYDFLPCVMTFFLFQFSCLLFY